MLLAYAGIHRLGMDAAIGFLLESDEILPAPGQGTLGIEIRTGDEQTQRYVETLNHIPTAQAALSERALLRHLEGGCQIPIGAFGLVRDDILTLNAMVGSLDGTKLIRDSVSGTADDPETLGRQLAERLLREGADVILRDIRTGGATL